MQRTRHGPTRPGLIYQHSTGERDRLVADRLNALVESTSAAREDDADDG
jgi:hypothetical protein